MSEVTVEILQRKVLDQRDEVDRRQGWIWE